MRNIEFTWEIGESEYAFIIFLVTESESEARICQPRKICQNKVYMGNYRFWKRVVPISHENPISTNFDLVFWVLQKSFGEGLILSSVSDSADTIIQRNHTMHSEIGFGFSDQKYMPLIFSKSPISYVSTILANFYLFLFGSHNNPGVTGRFWPLILSWNDRPTLISN